MNKEFVCSDCSGEYVTEMVCLEITTDPEEADCDDCGYYCDEGCCGGQWVDFLDATVCETCEKFIPPCDLNGDLCECELWTQDIDDEAHRIYWIANEIIQANPKDLHYFELIRKYAVMFQGVRDLLNIWMSEEKPEQKKTWESLKEHLDDIDKRYSNG